ncbi:hypothetical protein SYNPS1DRAFT_27153 [Syncephalis pseudoplumigaleata]|uniref:PHD-type domain-containing protein n=1 Tax=Syncephalis pseudoplumigaleata TaxID=1712513 RepID=A0A4P9Z3R5_9FUNG|nr:hypothetical protein SYNPS1DRAFT_27153 [Syncephalis pseudoplumigaleata]|eukprot:RKP27184.1 hypothetical protein SYNPS1DRAFT_27153 [Syncephalis pseudoplumigaleata]
MPNPYRTGGPGGRSGRVHGSLAAHANASSSSSSAATGHGKTGARLDRVHAVDTGDLCHLMLRTLASRMVARATPFTHLTTASTQVLAEVLALKLGQLARTVKLAAEMAGRTQATLQDVAIALDRVGTGQSGCHADSEAGYGGAIGRDQGELRRWCLSEAETSVKALGGNAVVLLQQLVQSGRVPPAPPYMLYEYRSEDEAEEEEAEEEEEEDMDVDAPLEPLTLTVEDEPDHRPAHIPRHLPALPSHDMAAEPIAAATATVAASTGDVPPRSAPSDASHQAIAKSKRKRPRHPNAEQADRLALAALQSDDSAVFMAKTIFNPASAATKHQFLAYEVPDTNLNEFMRIDYPGLFLVENKPRVSVKHIKQPAPPPPGATVTGPRLSLLTAQKQISAAPMDTLFGPCELGKVPSVSDTVQHLMQPAVVARLVTNNHTIRGRALPPPSDAATASAPAPAPATPVNVKIKSSLLSKKPVQASEEKPSKKAAATPSKAAPSVVSVVIPEKADASQAVTPQKTTGKKREPSMAAEKPSTSTSVAAPASTPATEPSSIAASATTATTTTAAPPAALSSPSTPATPTTGLPKIRLKIGKISIGLPVPSATSPPPVAKPAMHTPTVTAAPASATTATTTATTNNEPDEVINCICHTPTVDHGRFMIACDRCATWFHGECVHVGPDTVPEGTEWYCERCLAAKQQP